MESVAAEGLVVRPSRVSDGPFLQSLYQAARPDLQWIDGEHEQVQQVIAQQFQVQEQGLGENFPMPCITSWKNSAPPLVP